MKNFKILPKDIVRKEQDGQHHYFVGERYYTSVTRILDVAGPKEYGLMNFIKNNTPEDIEKIKQVTGDFGSAIHEAIEKLLFGVEIKMSDYSDPQKKVLMQFSEWFKTARPKQYLPEQTVAWEGIDEDRFAGTLDFLGEIDAENLASMPNMFTTKAAQAEFIKVYGGRKLLCLIDFKTTSGIYYSHKMQIGAYRLAAEQMFGREIDICAVVRLGTKHKCGYEMKMFDGEWASKMFLQVLETFKGLNGGKLPDPPMITVYPETIQLVETDMRSL